MLRITIVCAKTRNADAKRWAIDLVSES